MERRRLGLLGIWLVVTVGLSGCRQVQWLPATGMRGSYPTPPAASAVTAPTPAPAADIPADPKTVDPKIVYATVSGDAYVDQAAAQRLSRWQVYGLLTRRRYADVEEFWHSYAIGRWP